MGTIRKMGKHWQCMVRIKEKKLRQV